MQILDGPGLLVVQMKFGTENIGKMNFDMYNYDEYQLRVDNYPATIKAIIESGFDDVHMIVQGHLSAEYNSKIENYRFKHKSPDLVRLLGMNTRFHHQQPIFEAIVDELRYGRTSN